MGLNKEQNSQSRKHPPLTFFFNKKAENTEENIFWRVGRRMRSLVETAMVPFILNNLVTPVAAELELFQNQILFQSGNNQLALRTNSSIEIHSAITSLRGGECGLPQLIAMGNVTNMIAEVCNYDYANEQGHLTIQLWGVEDILSANTKLINNTIICLNRICSDVAFLDSGLSILLGVVSGCVGLGIITYKCTREKKETAESDTNLSSHSP